VEFLVCIEWIVFNPLMTCKMTLVTITYIMNHKHIIIESASMSSDSSNKEQRASLNKGILTAVMGKIEEFCPLSYCPACRRVLSRQLASPKSFCL